MRDRSLGLFLMALFGITGIAILILAWLWPVPMSDKVAAFLAGSIGVLIALAQLKTIRRSPGKVDNKHVLIEVEARDRP